MSEAAHQVDRNMLQTCPECGVPKVREAFRHERRVGERKVMVENRHCNKCDRAHLIARLARKRMMVR